MSPQTRSIRRHHRLTRCFLVLVVLILSSSIPRRTAAVAGSCVPPDAPIFIFTVTKTLDGYPILHFQDGNQPSQVTGYHVYLLSFILLSLHLPQLYMGFSWEREAELMSLFFLLAVGWDFLWFVHNPHFGLARFRPADVWWFGTWWLGVPADYVVGLAVSVAVYLAPGRELAARAGRWGAVAGVFAGLVLLSAVARRVTSSSRGARRPRPFRPA